MLSRIDLESLNLEKMNSLTKKLMESLKNNSEEYTRTTKDGSVTVFDSFYPYKSKIIIDKIDEELSRYYNFSDEELDYIINYDIKYRMGKALLGEDETEAEDE